MFRTIFSSLRCFAFCGLTIFFAASVVQADHYPEVVFILDSSGSMAEPAGNTTKIAAAKDVMHRIVPQLAPNVRIGLTAYGHRMPGDCQDIETLLLPGSDDREKLLAQVDRLQPRGKTPLSAAILSVASQIRMKDAETTIVLVSDGIETCGGDPCAVVKQLKSTGTKFVLHTVGFNVSQAAAAQLQCAAAAGDGKYFAAKDAEQLLESLKSVTAEIAEKVKQVDPATIARAAGVSGLGKLQVTMPVGSEVSLANLKIEKADSGDVYRAVKGPKSDATYPVVAGDYRIVLEFATPSYGKPTRSELGVLRVNKGETKVLKLGSMSFNIPEQIVDAIAVEEVRIVEPGTNETLVSVRKNGNSYYHFKPKPIVAGVYNVALLYSAAANDELAVAASNVVVEPGKDTVVTLNTAFQLKKADGVIGWELVRRNNQTADKNEDGARKSTTATVSIRYSGSGSRGRLWYPHLLPAGTYDLNVFLDGMKEPLPAGQNIVITAGQLLEFDAGL